AHPKPRALVWSPDGKTLVLATARKLVSFDARSGRAHTFALSGTRAAAFSPQGRLAVVRGTTVLLVEGGRTRRLFAAPARLAGLVITPRRSLRCLGTIWARSGGAPSSPNSWTPASSRDASSPPTVRRSTCRPRTMRSVPACPDGSSTRTPTSPWATGWGSATA